MYKVHRQDKCLPRGLEVSSELRKPPPSLSSDSGHVTSHVKPLALLVSEEQATGFYCEHYGNHQSTSGS